MKAAGTGLEPQTEISSRVPERKVRDHQVVVHVGRRPGAELILPDRAVLGALGVVGQAPVRSVALRVTAPERRLECPQVRVVGYFGTSGDCRAVSARKLASRATAAVAGSHLPRTGPGVVPPSDMSPVQADRSGAR